MSIEPFEISIKGKAVKVPSLSFGANRIVVLGKWMKVAGIHDEEWITGQLVSDPNTVVDHIRKAGLEADLFTFTQKIPDVTPRYNLAMEWDNAAAIRASSFKDWWEGLPQVSRKNVRRSQKRGVTVRQAEFNDAFVSGLMNIFSQTLIKQGIPFAHHGKDFETVKKEHSGLLDRSEFIGAYIGDELIGFIKLVYMGEIATILNIVTMDQHYDKRPANALITKAVELCEQRKMSHLLYGKFTYGNKTNSPLAEFKHRNGFEQVDFPRYYVPLTLKGKIFLKLNLHRGLLGILPAGVIAFLLKCRARFYQTLSALRGPKAAATDSAATAEPEAESAGA
jgi:hypothetical protein